MRKGVGKKSTEMTCSTSTSFEIVTQKITARARQLAGRWTYYFDGPDALIEPVTFSKNKNYTTIQLFNAEAKEFVHNATGKHYTTLHLKEDDRCYPC